MHDKKIFESGAVDFLFNRDDNLLVIPTAYVFGVLVTFDTAPSTAGLVQLVYENAENADFAGVVKETQAQNKSSVYLEFRHSFPVSRGESLRVKYANTDNRKVAVVVKHSYK